ncbi:MAG: thermonuclease family protein [Methyloceanibacter sp.]
MKFLSLLVSLMLGAAVILVFIRPWDALQSMIEDASRETPAAPAKPSPAAGGTEGGMPAVEPGSVTAGAPRANGTPPEPTPEEPRPHLLAREQAEAERSAALKDKTEAAAPKPVKTRRYFKVKVRDAGTLEADLPGETVVIRLAGIDSHAADATCKRENGTNWPCGAKARAALTRYIRYRAVTCTLPPGGESADFAARCSLRGRDLSVWLVRRGWARPKSDEPEFTKAMAAAINERLGLWAGE